MTWHRRQTTRPGTQPPAWPDDDMGPGFRVLVEHPEPIAREIIVRGLQQHGYDVVSCGGPDDHGGTGNEPCPVLHGERCPGVDGADVVVSSLNLGRQSGRTIVQTITNDPLSPPVHLEASEWQVATALGPEAGVSHHHPFASVDQIATAIEKLQVRRS